MFGYVRPRKDELKVRDWEAYQAVYCGLCHTLGRRYGLLPRMFLNYDFVFLVMVLDGGKAPPVIHRRRCLACPLRGKPSCQGGQALERAADESVILTYWKLRDSVADRSFWKGIFARLLSLLLRPSYRKAAARVPDFDRQVVTCLEELQALEQAGSPSLDRTADTVARILQGAAPAAGPPDRDRAVAQMLYHVGRWIYLTDAWDDLQEDRESGAYNPAAARWPDGPEAHGDELRTTLRHSLNLAASAYSLADFGCWSDILANILYLGLPMVEEAVFTGRWRRLKNQLGRRHET